MGVTRRLRRTTAHGRGKGFPGDYHDYVFKDGKLIGDFDDMYRYAKGVPWEQDKRCDGWHAEVGMLVLKEQAPYDTVLEIGCGLGYITAKLKTFTRGAIDAFDVSSEAIRKACGLHSGIHFYVDDITKTPFRPQRRYGLVVVRELFWYVFPHMETVIQKVNKCVKPEGFLYLGQSFPALDSQFVGKEVIPTPDALMTHFSNYQPIYTALLRNHRLVRDGPFLHFLGKKSR